MQTDQKPQPLAWKKLSPLNGADFPQTTTYSKASLFENYVLFFGRYISQTNQILTFNLETLNWVSIPLHIPSEDHLLAAAISYTVIPYGEDKFILYGGSQTGRPYLEMITIQKVSSTEENGQRTQETSPLQIEWQDLSRSITETLPFRRYFTANICDDKMYIYGGLDSKNKIDPSLHIIYLGSGSYVNRIQFGVNSLKPGARYNHGSVLEKGSLYIYGGYSEDARCLNDLWVLNLETMEWQELASRSQISTPKINSLCQVIEDTIVIAGGTNGQGWCQDCITYKINDEMDSFKKLDLAIEQPISQNQTFLGVYNDRLLLVKDFDFFSLDQKAIVPEEQPKEQVENVVKTISFQRNDQKFFKEKPFADLIFRVQGEEMKAHKAFLAARCSYFINMFQSGMIEGNSSIIDVPDITPQTFNAFLEFIYCGEVTSEDEGIWLDLLELADKYCMETLEELCSRSMKGKMNKENVVKTANLAERLGMEDLKHEALTFMAGNFDEVFESQDIRELSRELIMELFKMK